MNKEDILQIEKLMDEADARQSRFFNHLDALLVLSASAAINELNLLEKEKEAYELSKQSF